MLFKLKTNHHDDSEYRQEAYRDTENEEINNENEEPGEHEDVFDPALYYHPEPQWGLNLFFIILILILIVVALFTGFWVFL